MDPKQAQRAQSSFMDTNPRLPCHPPWLLSNSLSACTYDRLSGRIPNTTTWWRKVPCLGYNGTFRYMRLSWKMDGGHLVGIMDLNDRAEGKCLQWVELWVVHLILCSVRKKWPGVRIYQDYGPWQVTLLADHEPEMKRTEWREACEWAYRSGHQGVLENVIMLDKKASTIG